MDITFDNVSLNTSPYRVTGLKHEHASPRETFLYDLARERGSILIDADYKSKEIVIAGRITGDTQADLEDNIDAFKELISRINKSLDIEYSTGTRRYKNAYSNDVVIDRQFFHLSYAPFEVKFIVPSGVGEDTALTTDTETGITVASKSDSIVIGGSAYPTPNVKLTFSAVSGGNQVSLTLGGDKVTFDGTLATSDVLIFDIENKKVTLNGVEKDYVGLFPKFAIGTNNYQVDINGTSRTYAIEISYKKKWL